MHVDLINALTGLLHELGPWAAVAIAAIGAWQATRAKQEAKEARLEAAAAKTLGKSNAIKIDTNRIKTESVVEKLQEVHETVNGRMDQLQEAAKQEGRREVEAEIRQQSIGGP